MPANDAETTVVLHDVQGIARHSGECRNGLQWIEYELDTFTMDEPTPDTCSICDAEITSGWLCLDGGETVCASHVSYE
jgi:hypothetical protein